MVPGVGRPSIAARSAVALAALALLAGCGGSLKHAASASARVPTDSQTPAPAPGNCPATVLGILTRVATRVYHEGVESERTDSAQALIKNSRMLREAVEGASAAGARAAARALIATGHMTNLLIESNGRVLADVGSRHAFAPLRGTLTGASGAPIASFVASVWDEAGLTIENNGIIQGKTSLRLNERTLGGSFVLPRRGLGASGTFQRGGVRYQYSSFPATLFPSGAPLRVYLVKTVRSTAAECGATEQDTIVDTLSRVAKLIYEGESGARALAQVERVQHDGALLRAVERRDPLATRAAVERLLNEHIVRLAVSAGGQLLSDVGGPFVLAPVRGELRAGGRAIGSFVLSIQDDEGYLRLTHRLAGLDVLMFMGPLLVMNSLGPAPGPVPASGAYRYHGHSFRVFSFRASSFPSGPLRIQVLIPIPYS